MDDETLRIAIGLWESGKYHEAEQVLSATIEQHGRSLTVRDEAELRIKLAYALKYQEQFTRAFSEMERVLALPALPSDLEARAWALIVSVNAELGRLDRVEQLASDNPASLGHLALAYYKAGQTDAGHATVEREIALAEHAGDRVRVLMKRSELALWRAVRPGKTGVTEDMRRASLSELDTCEAGLTEIDNDTARRAVQLVHTFRPAVQNAGRLDLAGDDLRSIVANARGRADDRASAQRFLVLSLLDRGDADSLAEAHCLNDEIFALLIDIEPPRRLATSAYVAALIDRGLGRFKRDFRLFRSAIAWLEHADRWISGSRVEYREPGIEATDETRRALDVDARKIQSLAIEILLNDLQAFSEGFDWVERSKGGVLAEIIGTSPLPVPRGLPSTIVAEEARALEKLKGAANHAEAWAAQVALGRVWERIAKLPEGAEYVALRRGTSMRYAEVREMLAKSSLELKPRRLVLIEYVVMGDQLLAFGVASDEEAATVRRVPLSVSAFRSALEVALSDTDKRLEAMLSHRFVAACVEPILACTSPDDVVCIVPAGPLFQLPFHAIPVAGGPLMFRNPVFYAPSATTLQSCMARRAAGGTPHEAAVFGDPDEDLPDARREAAAVAQSLGVAPIMGRDVTVDAVLHAAAIKNVLHFSGHTFFQADDPFASGLCVAGHQVVTAREFLASPGTMRLMTLSGCSTGINDVRPGDELLGFTRAMLFAGAASLLVTLWPIDDDASSALMTAFYDRWLTRGESKVDALRGAQLDVIRAGFTKPHQWAPFTLLGEWR